MESSIYLTSKYKHLQKEYDSAVQCNRCGFCETVCPTYVLSGKETLSPRGRNQAFRQILEGKIADPKQAEDIFSTCLTCHACTNVCFSEVPVSKLMAHAKNIIAEGKKLNSILSQVIGLLLSHRKFLSFFIWTAFLLKRVGCSALLKRIGILNKISPELNMAADIVENVPLSFGATPLFSPSQRGKHKRLESNSQLSTPNAQLQNVAYFSGCGIHYLYPNAAKACLEILSNSEKKVLCPNTPCCGLMAHSFGDIKSAKLLAERNIRQFENLGAEMIVVDDDSCGGFMKSYGELLDGQLNAVAFSHKIKNLSEFLISVPKGARTEFLKKTGNKVFRVTYHDPCQMGNAHKQWNEPRNILKNLPGVTFIELEESNWCCGGAGTYCLKNHELAEEVLERKLENILKSKADVLITQAASCLMHISYGIRKKGLQNIQVMHLAELLYSKFKV